MTSDLCLYKCGPNPVWSLHRSHFTFTFVSGLPSSSTNVPHHPSLYPDGVVAIRPPWVGRCRSAGRGEVAERGEKLFHLFLKHLISPLGVVLGALGVAQLDLCHGVFLPLLVQLLVEVHHFWLQLKVALLQATKQDDVGLEKNKGSHRLDFTQVHNMLNQAWAN